MWSSRSRVPRLAAWRSGVALLTLALLAGCGFQLRGQANYPFQTIYASATGGPSFTSELRRALAASGSATVADEPTKAQVVLDIVLVANDKAVLSLSSGGRAREFALSKRVQFALRDKEGNEWMPPAEIVILRTFTYDDSERLAREIQEQRLDREMQTDAIQQIVRRLQTARKPA
jgi:LPS-assembly lipoprotein